MLEIQIDNAAISSLQRLADSMPEAVQAGEMAVGQMASGILNRAIGRIYERVIPRSPTGRPLWKRSGDLRRSPGQPSFVGADLIIPLTGRPVIPITNWPGGYAEKRSKLGVSWVPRFPAGTRRRPDRGLIRRNDFLGDTRRFVETHAEAVFMERFRRQVEVK